jgi:hypothetical protein
LEIPIVVSHARLDRTIVTAFLAPGIEEEVGDLAHRPIPQSVELLDEFGSGPTHVGRGNLEPAELLVDGRHVSGAAAGTYHGGHDEHQSARHEGPGREPSEGTAEVLLHELVAARRMAAAPLKPFTDPIRSPL